MQSATAQVCAHQVGCSKYVSIVRINELSTLFWHARCNDDGCGGFVQSWDGGNVVSVRDRSSFCAECNDDDDDDRRDGICQQCLRIEPRSPSAEICKHFIIIPRPVLVLSCQTMWPFTFWKWYELNQKKKMQCKGISISTFSSCKKWPMQKERWLIRHCFYAALNSNVTQELPFRARFSKAFDRDNIHRLCNVMPRLSELVILGMLFGVYSTSFAYEIGCLFYINPNCVEWAIRPAETLCPSSVLTGFVSG